MKYVLYLSEKDAFRYFSYVISMSLICINSVLFVVKVKHHSPLTENITHV